MSFATDIEAATQGKEILGIVVGTFGGSSWNDEDDAAQYAWGRSEGMIPVPNKMKNKVLKWDDVRKYLDYKYSSDFGVEECHPITAWTESHVLICGRYDGSTWVTNIPRNPTDHTPAFVGGG